jgi:hypothetical protein
MLAYVVTASLPAYGPEKFRVLLYHAGNKACAKAAAESSGWLVKRISSATADDVHELKEHQEALRLLHRECAKRREEEVQQARLAERASRAEAESQRRDRERQDRLSEERRQSAIDKTLGDLLTTEPEGSALKSRLVAEICAKVLLFFDQAAINKADVYTSISLDYARFQVSAAEVPNAASLLRQVVHDLNSFLAIEAKITESQRRVENERRSAEAKINSIESRSHIFGGSGDGLIVSWLCAESAASQDRKQAQFIAGHQGTLEREFVSAYQSARARQRLLEVRARTAVSLLSPNADGSHVSLDIPPDIEALADVAD